MQIQIPLPQKTKVIKQENNRATFEVEGCYPGYGITFGNALRRIILSSLSGAAVTGIKIKGVQHEFSTLPHVMEDVIEITLNLKQLRFRVATEDKYKLTLTASGEKQIKASDIKIPSGIEIINKDAHIATLTDKKASLEMEIEVETGLGYSPVEQRSKEKLEIGMIPVDASFSPIQKVNFEVENMRVGDRTDYNRLVIDIETDGSITSEAAFKKAATILVDQFKVLVEVEKEKKRAPVKMVEEKEEERAEAEEDVTKIPVDDLKFSTRVANVLKEAGIKTVSGLLKKGETTLMETEGMGEKGVREIKRALSKFGLELKD